MPKGLLESVSIAVFADKNQITNNPDYKQEQPQSGPPARNQKRHCRNQQGKFQTAENSMTGVKVVDPEPTEKETEKEIKQVMSLFLRRCE